MISRIQQETVRLVPHSGIQFLVLEFNLEEGPRFSRTFIEYKRVELVAADGSYPVELRPGWNDDDMEAEPPYKPQGADSTYDISKQKALEPFLSRWVPVPYLAIQPRRDAWGRDLYHQGPTNWSRVCVSAIEEPQENGATHRAVFAFDTELLERRPNRAYVGPSPQDAFAEQEFGLAFLFRDIAAFLSDPRTIGDDQIDYQEWVDRWVDELFIEFKMAQRGGRSLRPDDRETLEHAARYISFIQLLDASINMPRIKLIDTVSSEPAVKPVDVDLVLDIGNSRTCGMLIENFPNQQKVDLGNSFILLLRDLEEPHRFYKEPFESDVQLAQALFGKEHLSRASSRSRAFFWPSLVRVGAEAARYRERGDGTEGTSGMSSPKRYLCDVEPVNQEWRFQPGDYAADGAPPTIYLAARRFMNFRGDVLRQLSDERRFYERLASAVDRAELEKPAVRLTFSRSSFFTLLVTEILVQTLSLINSPQVRGSRGEKDTPRRLRRIIFTLPTAMPVREQRLLRSRAQAGVKLVWDLMGWSENPPPGVLVPEVHASWDEASCAQFVYLYSEIAHKFGGNITDFLTLVGTPRPFAEPHGAPQGVPQPSLRIASIDVGGGTTDLMIATYYAEANRAIVPSQTFREGFRIAGEDLLREVIQQVVLPAIADHLRTCGVANARELLIDRFGADRANMAQQDKHFRRHFVLRLLRPIGLALLQIYEKAEPGAVSLHKLSDLIDSSFEGRIIDYIDKTAVNWGAKDFHLKDVEITVDPARMAAAVSGVLGQIFENIAEAVHHFDCDIVLLSGRPSGLPGTIDLFINKLAVAPEKVIPLSNYSAGNWYPFGGHSRFRIEDPKTATVVGGMLCALAETQITNFTLYVDRITMRSTANYIGVLERDGKMHEANVLFVNGESSRAPQVAKVDWFAPMPLGFRQLPLERWVATPMYRIKPVGTSSLQAIQKPVTIVLERELPEELLDYDDRNFSAAEAQKEEIRLVEATARDGANVTRSFGLYLDTLSNEEIYWLDSGILNVN